MSEHHSHAQVDSGQHHKAGHYGRFALELLVDFVVMYLVMYAMIATLRHFHFNLNNVYMALMMLAPMSIVMLLAMPAMLPSRAMNAAIVGALAVFVLSFAGMRWQVGIGDKELLRAMIPHHSGAILMCEEASLTDPEVIALCASIVETQQREIAQMEAILDRL